MPKFVVHSLLGSGNDSKRAVAVGSGREACHLRGRRRQEGQQGPACSGVGAPCLHFQGARSRGGGGEGVDSRLHNSVCVCVGGVGGLSLRVSGAVVEKSAQTRAMTIRILADAAVEADACYSPMWPLYLPPSSPPQRGSEGGNGRGGSGKGGRARGKTHAVHSSRTGAIALAQPLQRHWRRGKGAGRGCHH